MKSNIFLGFLGAFVGAMIGSVLWIVLYQVGVIAYIAGIAMITLACKGYALLGKTLDLKGLIIAILVALLVLTGTHVFCWGLEIYNANSQENNMTILDGIQLIPLLIKENNLILDFVKEFLIGFVLICVGAAPYVKKILHYRNAEINSNL